MTLLIYEYKKKFKLYFVQKLQKEMQIKKVTK
jgi:hypothetical protein